MCLIAVSKEIGLFRAYPLRVEQKEIRVWSECDFSLELNERDGRSESYRLSEVRFNYQVVLPEHKKIILESLVLKSGEDDPVEYQNKNFSSIAVVKPEISGGSIQKRESEIRNLGDDSLDSWVVCQAESNFKPTIEWSSSQDKKHSHHLVSQEAYEYLRKNPLDPWRLFSNYQISNPEYDYWLVLGNMKDRRNVWVVVHIHRIKKNSTENFILPSLMTIVGNQEGWPYLKQEKMNVKFVGEQAAFKFTTSNIKKAGIHGNIPTPT